MVAYSQQESRWLGQVCCSWLVEMEVWTIPILRSRYICETANLLPYLNICCLKNRHRVPLKMTYLRKENYHFKRALSLFGQCTLHISLRYKLLFILFQRKLSDSQVCQCGRTSSILDGILSLLLLLELQHDLQQTQEQEIPMVIREMHIIDSLLIII